MILNRTNANRIKNASIGAAKADAEMGARIDGARIGCMLAKITSSATIAGTTYRWLYDWTRAEIDLATVGSYYDFRQRPSEGFYTGKALNVCEGMNSASFVGPGIDPANIPAGFTVQPVSGYVLLYPMRRRTDATVGSEIMWCFYSCNAIDGACV